MCAVCVRACMCARACVCVCVLGVEGGVGVFISAVGLEYMCVHVGATGAETTRPMFDAQKNEP